MQHIQVARRDLLASAVQFDPRAKWPEAMHSWSEAGYRPCDGSGGFVTTAKGRVHVQPGDWIITDTWGKHTVCKNTEFSKVYARLADERERKHGEDTNDISAQS